MSGGRYYQEELRSTGRKRIYWILPLGVVERFELEARRRKLGPAALAALILEEWLEEQDQSQPTKEQA